MTGADIKRIFYSKYDEITNGIISPTRLNDQFLQATTEYFMPLLREYGRTGAINDELRCLQTTVTVTSPANYLIAFASMPLYQSLTSIETTYTENGQTYVKTAIQLPYNAMNKSYSDGKVYAPRYEIMGTNVRIYPKSGTLSKVDIEYLTTPPVINVTDAATQLTYSDQNVSGIVDKVMSIYASSLGDMEAYNVAERSEVQNTNTAPRR
tara:strand:- start:225 stop:851 length:627 start_codon:yes stop_codon:yes gene_type:complete